MAGRAAWAGQRAEAHDVVAERSVKRAIPWQDYRPPDATVPRRFGLLTMLGALTLFSLGFMLLEAFQTPGWLILHISLFLSAVSLAQMLFPAAPRQASIRAGAIYLPVALVVSIPFSLLTERTADEPRYWTVALAVMLISSFVGAGLGYLVGTLMAGLFLILQSISPGVGRAEPHKPARAIEEIEPT